MKVSMVSKISAIATLLTTKIYTIESFTTNIITSNQNRIFFSSSIWGYSSDNRSRSSLFAKKTKKKSVGSGGGGGFGSSKVTTKKKVVEDENYSIFPELEDQVKATVLPIKNEQYALLPRDEEDVDDDLRNEIYDRLYQIYGFSNFNSKSNSKSNTHAFSKKEEESSTSLDDLLSSSSSTPTAITSSSVVNSLFLQDNDEDEKDDENNNEPQPPPYHKIPPFEKVKVIHLDPLIITIDDFFTTQECDDYVALISPTASEEEKPLEIKSKTVAKDTKSKKQRSSTTWFHYYTKCYKFLSKCNRLLGLNTLTSWEEPQIVRYKKNEKYNWHLDALGLDKEDVEGTAGQRIATVLVYLNDLGDEMDGGCTMFRDLKGNHDDDSFLKIRPEKGKALLFFPSAGGILNNPFDIRTLHAGEPVLSTTEDKWIAQLWLRKGRYVPTAPTKDNLHSNAIDAIENYCNSF